MSKYSFEPAIPSNFDKIYETYTSQGTYAVITAFLAGEKFTYREEEHVFRRNEKFHDFCKKNGFVIAYGASDDLIEFYGAINDGTGLHAHINTKGLIEHQNNCPAGEECPHYITLLHDAFEVHREYDDANEYYKFHMYYPKGRTFKDYKTYLVYEDDEIFGELIVFNLDDLKGT